MMILLVNIVGARGVFKYYFVAIVPFFSIFSSARMIRGTGDHVPFSASMVLLPIPFSLLILLPDRNFYMLYVILIFVLYTLAPVLDKSYDLLKRVIRKLTDELPLSFDTLSIKTPLVEPRTSKAVTWITRVFSLVIGLSLVVFGCWFSMQAIGANPIWLLTVLLVMGIALTLAPQMISLFLSSWDDDDFNSNLFSFSFTTAALSLLFGLGTYIQGWNVSEFSARLPLFYSSIFVTIWACSLFINMGILERLTADILLLGGTSLGLVFWSILNDSILQVIGLLSASTIVLHLLLVIIGLIHSRTNNAASESI
jgi:hypothetical protein